MCGIAFIESLHPAADTPFADPRTAALSFYMIFTKKRAYVMEQNIVLAEPQIPQNTGNIARTCAVTGARLHLIKPMGFSVDDKKLKHAGLDYWHYLDISYYDGFDDFFEKTCGKYFYYSTKAVNTYCDVTYPDKCYLVFGREDKGLPEDLLYRNKDLCVRIPMIDEMRSLNLSNSAAIGAYEVLRQWGFPKLQNKGQLTEYVWKSENNA